MSAYSELIRNQVNNADQVLEAHKVQGKTIIDALLAEAQRCNVPLSREAATEVLSAVAGILRFDRQSLHTAEDAVVLEKSDDPQAILAKDTARAELLSRVQRVRNLIDDSLGLTGLRTYGFADPPVDQDQPLLTYARTAADLLAAKPANLDLLGHTLSTVALSEQLRAEVVRLDQALGAIKTEARELQLVIATRNTAQARFKRTYSATSNAFVAFLELSEQDALADRLKPTQRKLRGEAVVELPEPTPAALSTAEGGTPTDALPGT